MGYFSYHKDLAGPWMSRAKEIKSSVPAGGLLTGFSVMTGYLCNLLLAGQSNTVFTAGFGMLEQLSKGA